MQPSPRQGPSRHDHLPATGPAVEDHGRVVTANPRAAGWYRRAQRAAGPRRAAAALRLAVSADPDFGLAVADLVALTGIPDQQPAGQAMNWERHHIEVVATAAAGQATRAADLLREHLASVGCDPLAIRIVARLQPSTRPGDDFEDLAGSPAVTPPHGPVPHDALTRAAGVAMAFKYGAAAHGAGDCALIYPGVDQAR